MLFLKSARILGLCLGLSSWVGVSAVAGLLPGQLQCESKPDPVGLSEISPRLSWQDLGTNAAERGQYQSAYQIQVASTPELLAAGTGDLWDTGAVATNRTAQIVYAGPQLASHQVCYWHVRVWDKDQVVSPWSSPASWSMGLLSQAEWTAQWIGRDDAPAWDTGSTFTQAKWIWFPEGSPASSAPVGTRWFRKVFNVPNGVSLTQAVATMTADNAFTLYVNGQVALSGDNWQQYAQADIGTLLIQGSNVLAVAVDNTGSSANPAGLIGSLDLTYSNGTTNSVRTDSTWISANQLYANWNQTNFTAVGWSNAQVLGNYGISPWNGFVKHYLAATYLRKDFNLAQQPARAVLYVTGQGLMEPHVNGTRVGQDYFIPGWTDYAQRLYYRAYDVTSLIQAGPNTLGAILGDGWYRGNCAFDGQYFYGTKTRLRAQLHLFYTNAAPQVITSDSSWKAGFGPIREADNQAGETYDARLEQSGWDSPGFNPAGWNSATVGAEVSPVIQAHPAEPVQVRQSLAPVSITQPQPGLYVVNFGQNISGWVRLQVTNQPAGRRIVMRFGEWLNPDGTVFRDNLRSARATDTYICKGGGVETWEPHFTFHGFQFMEVQGLAQPPTADAFVARAVDSGLADAGAFLCSSPLINRIGTNMLWSVRDNYLEVPTDCPQRDERAGWCDGIEVMRSGMFYLQGESFFSKWYQDIVDTKARATASDYGQQAPLVGDFGFSAGWQDCVVFVPYWLYQTYGDLRPAERGYSNMVDHLNYYAAHSSNYIGPNSGYGDWVAADGSTPLNLVSTAFYARCAGMVAELAQALGKTADAAMYRQLYTNICTAFQANFVAADGTVGSGSEGGYALAFEFNLLTPAQKILAANKLAGSVAAQNGNPSTGMVTTHLLFPALTQIGRSDLAYAMLAKTNYPSWGFEVGLGATTIWELWNSINGDGTVNTSQDGMNSLNHANFGTCAQWFFNGILGLDLLQPGFQKVLIAPQPGGGLTWARGYYDSVQGRITTTWTNTSTQFQLNVVIPPNATAEVHVPTTNTAAITESGTPAGSAAGVTYVGYSNNTAIYDVVAGSYAFVSPYPLTAVTAPALVVTTANQIGTGSGTFFPNWTVQTNGSLIAGRSPSTATGNFSEEISGRDVLSLTRSNNLGLTLINGPSGITSSTNYVTCGNGYGAGATLSYQLPGSTRGYDLTNITVYGGWADSGRDQQAYTVYYATADAPATFKLLGSVSYNPAVGGGVQSATRVMLTASAGVLATNAVAVKFDFTSPASENGYCGYAAIAVFGSPSLAPVVPTSLGATFLTDSGLALSVESLVPGRNYELQSTTNLTTGQWITETNFIPATATITLTNPAAGETQKFYRVWGQ